MTLPDREAEACRPLWIAVLTRSISDAVNPTAFKDGESREMIARNAVSWIGSRGFRDVCELAGVCPRRLEARIRKLVQAPVPMASDGRHVPLRARRRELAA